MHSPRPNHSIMMAGMVPNRLPYANPSNIVAVHNALTVEMLSTSIWEIMNSDDTMHRQYARGMWRRVRMKSEIRPMKCWYDKKRRAKSATYDDSTGTVAYAQCRYLCGLPLGRFNVVVLWVHLGIESQGNGTNVVNICIKVNGRLAVVKRTLTHDASAAHFQMPSEMGHHRRDRTYKA